MKITKSDKEIIKKYNWDQLYSEQNYVKNRLDRISQFSKRCDFIPKIDIEYSELEKSVTIIQKFIPNNGKLDQYSLSVMSKNLELMHKSNIVHGDIRLMNIRVFDGKIHLIDFEPCYIQIRKGIFV